MAVGSRCDPGLQLSPDLTFAWALGIRRRWLTLQDTYLSFAETPRNPTNSRKPTFALAESRHSFSGPEFRKQSPTDENRFFNLAVGSAA